MKPATATVNKQQQETVPVDQLQAVIFYLMTQHSFSHSPSVAREIADHVQLLLHHPNIELMPKQYAVLSSVLNHWRLHSCPDTATERAAQPILHGHA